MRAIVQVKHDRGITDIVVHEYTPEYRPTMIETLKYMLKSQSLLITNITQLPDEEPED